MIAVLIVCSTRVGSAKEIEIAELKVIDGNSSCKVTNPLSLELETGPKRFETFFPFRSLRFHFVKRNSQVFIELWSVFENNLTPVC